MVDEPSTLKIELIYWPATTFAARAEAQAGAVPLHRGMAETAPHPTRTRGAFARRIRGPMASQAASTRSATLQRKGAEKPREKRKFTGKPGRCMRAWYDDSIGPEIPAAHRADRGVRLASL